METSQRPSLSVETEVETLIDPATAPEYVAAAVAERGPAHIDYAVRLLDRRAGNAERRIDARELQLRIARAAEDWTLARRVLVSWFGDERAPRRLVRLLTGMAEDGDLAGADALLQLARSITGPGALQRASEALAALRQSRANVEARPPPAASAGSDALAAALAAGAEHDWAEARRRLAPQTGEAMPAEAAHFAAICGIYAQAQDPAAAPVRRLDGVDIRYINLDRDTERRDRIEAAIAACGLELIRSPAVRGGWLPRAAKTLIAFNNKRSMGQGTLACFLSHVRAWELVAAGERASLILEDDATPLLRFGSVLERVTPAVGDICFVNRGMSHILRRVFPNPAGFETAPILSVSDLYLNLPNPPGGCGYILTPRGARKLLDYVTADGSLGHVDSQMLSYCLPVREQVVTEDSSIRLRRLRRQADLHQGERLLDASVLHPPLIDHFRGGDSTRLRG